MSMKRHAAEDSFKQFIRCRPLEAYALKDHFIWRPDQLKVGEVVWRAGTTHQGDLELSEWVVIGHSKSGKSALVERPNTMRYVIRAMINYQVPEPFRPMWWFKAAEQIDTVYRKHTLRTSVFEAFETLMKDAPPVDRLSVLLDTIVGLRDRVGAPQKHPAENGNNNTGGHHG